jgi:hypothetical protein
MAETDSTTKIGKQTIEFNELTRKSEQWNTQLLEGVLGKSDTISERESILKLVAQTNQERRTLHPDMHLAELQFDSHIVGDRHDLELRIKLGDEPSHVLYEELDWPGKDGKDIRQPIIVGVHDGSTGDTNSVIYFLLQLYQQLGR